MTHAIYENGGGLAYLRAGKTVQLDHAVTFQAPWPAIVHDVAITDRHVVAFICPLVFDFLRKGPPAVWEPDRDTMVALVPRDAPAPARRLNLAPSKRLPAMTCRQGGRPATNFHPG